MTASLRPLHDNVLVLRDPSEHETPGGILIPDAHQQKPRAGTVVATGIDADDLHPGDRVLFSSYAGTEILLDDIPHLIMSTQDILGCLEEDA